jgi:hypothetical protein
MAIRLKVQNGKMAIYTVPTIASTDDAPLANPLANASRVRFHSDLNYVRVISTHTGTLTLPVRATQTQVKVDHVLFAHGQASVPMVMGRITNLPAQDGTMHKVPLGSMVPVGIYTPNGKYANESTLHRWVCLAVDETNVYLREYGFVSASGYRWIAPNNTPQSYADGWTAQSINWVVHVTDFLVTGPAPTVDMTKPSIIIDDDKVEAGYGKFLSSKRIPRLNAAGVDYAMPKDRHIAYNPIYTLADDSMAVGLEVSLAGMWWRKPPGIVANITAPSFAPALHRCDL